MRVAVLASGRGSNLQAIIDRANRATVSLVVSDQQSGALDVARRAGINHVYLPREPGEQRASYDERLKELLQAEKPDLVVLAGFMRILGASVVQAFSIINIHPSLLPSFPGANGVRDTLQSGAKLAGCTTHVVTPGVDEGPILLQAAIPIQADDSLEALQARVLQLEHQLLPRTIDLIARGECTLPDGKMRASSTWRDAVDLVPDACYPAAF